MQLSDPDTALLRSIETVIGTPPAVIGVAVSGGGDSMALLHLLHLWASDKPVTVQAVTVDHGLRKAAADEAQGVAEFCARIGVEHCILQWTGWDGSGNLQDQARRARYGLMTAWAQARGIEVMALGHTADDQAETVLMRLARGSGVDGLSGMQPVRKADGIAWGRPVLDLYRQQLRDHLVRHDIQWVDDPSNEDERFDRVKARKVLTALAPLGIDVERLAGTAQNLQVTRDYLEQQTEQAAREMATVEGGDVQLERGAFNELHPEIHARLLSHALCWVGSADYRPRRLALTQTQAALRLGKSSTLHGCRILVSKAEIRITREHQAVKSVTCPSDAAWDNRWQMTGPHAAGLEIRALGEAGLAQCPDWRSTDLPRAALLATPAVWQNTTLIAAPLAGLPNGWAMIALFGLDHFISSIIPH